MNYWDTQREASVAAWKADEELDGWKPWMRTAKPKRAEPRGKKCPTCFMEKPLVGDCQNCD